MLQALAFSLTILLPLGLIAQSSYSIEPPLGERSQARQTETGTAPRSGAHQRVTLSVKDSSLAYVLRTLTKEAGLGAAFDRRDPVYSKPVTVQLRDMEIMEAISFVLQGTDLVVSLSPNGETLMVHKKTAAAGKTVDSVGIIAGKVIDSATQKGLPGATVSLAGTTVTVVTGANGAFHIANVPVGSRAITVKMLGYNSRSATVTVEPNKVKAVSVVLHQTSTALSEVVTTATGMQRRIEVPSDIVKIDPEKIMERASVRNLTDLIEAAHVPGVLIQRGNGEPGSPSRIRIRGLKTITQSKDPVVIVDGNFIDASVGTPSGIDDIDPSIIETIEIVRGPSASTLYGQDAANGVIVITTKKGRAGPTRWRTSYNRDWGQTYGRIPLIYIGLGYDAASGQRIDCPIASVIEGRCVQDSLAILDPNHSLLQREGNGVTHRFVLGVEGGSSATTYSLNASSDRTIGIRRMMPIDQIRYRILGFPVESKFQEPTGEDKRTVNVGLTMLPNTSLTVGVSLIGTQTDLIDNQIVPNFGGLTVNGIGGADKEYSLDTVGILITGSGIEAVESPTRRSNMGLGGQLNWRAPRGWFVGANGGINRSIVETSLFRRGIVCPRATPCTDTTGQRAEQDVGRTELTARMNVRKQLDLGTFSRLLDLRPTFGADFRKQDLRSMRVSATKIPAGENSLTGGDAPIVQYSSLSTASAGWYVSVTVGVLQRLYFDIGTRQDMASTMKSLGGGMRFPKIGGSWLVSNEPFWQRAKLGTFIESLRLRTAVGYAAIQPDAGDINGRYRNATEYVGQKFVRAVMIDATGNLELKPERAMEAEIGFDMDLLNDRVSIIANYAHVETQNAMILRALPPSAGVDTRRKENIGRVRNRNFEATTQIRPIDNSMARLELSHTATLRENIVVSLGDKITPFSNLEVGRIEEGYPIAGVWVKPVLGYRDRNDDGLLAWDEVVSSDSTVYVGWTQPRYEAGYGMNLTMFGQLTFDTRFSHRSRYVQHYSRNNRYGLEDINAPLNLQADALVGNMNNRRSISDLRWNSASVSYHIPQRMLQAMKVRSLSVSVRGSNLGLWTNYSGRDPGVNSDILISEISRERGNEIPRPRIFNLSFDLGF